jgi:hypothetical protein
MLQSSLKWRREIDDRYRWNEKQIKQRLILRAPNKRQQKERQKRQQGKGRQKNHPKLTFQLETINEKFILTCFGFFR